MQQPIDAVCTFACAAMHDASRAAGLFAGSEPQFACLCVEMAETALDNLSQLEGRLDATKNQTVLVSVQSAYMKLQANQSASTVCQWVSLLDEAQRSYLCQATEWNDQFQHRPGTAASSAQLLIVSPNSWQTLVNIFDAIAASATQARPSS